MTTTEINDYREYYLYIRKRNLEALFTIKEEIVNKKFEIIVFYNGVSLKQNLINCVFQMKRFFEFMLIRHRDMKDIALNIIIDNHIPELLLYIENNYE